MPIEWPAGTTEAHLRWVRLAPNGDVVETGRFYAPMNLAERRLVPNGGSDVYLVKRDERGRVLWSAQEGSAGLDNPLGLAVDDRGNSVLLWHVDRSSPQELTVVKYAP